MGRTKLKEVSLSDNPKNEQMVVLAQITRNQYALDYWFGNLATVQEMSIFRHETKQMFNRIRNEYMVYNATIQSMFHKDPNHEVDAYEMLLDSAQEFHREVKKMVGYYEQAIHRMLGKTDLPHRDWLCKLSTAKDLLDIVSIADGMEGYIHHSISPILRAGGMVEMPIGDDHGGRVLPSVMGHFTRMAGQMNMLILRSFGQNEDIRYDVVDDPDVQRTMGICGQQIVSAIMDYNLIFALFEGYGHTLEEAKLMLSQHKAEQAERERKDKEKAIKKAAKAEYKQQSKSQTK